MWCKTIPLLFFISLVSCEDPVVTIKNGKIRGRTAITSRYNLTFYSYVGIPFAAPPVGNLRFEPPHPVANWNGIFEANNSLKSCYQINRKVQLESEDCLQLNVFTPEKPGTKASLPVYVFIHGGGFVEGEHITASSPQFLLEDNVIVVAMNYRLGPFGFLSTGDLVVPGNMGLKDQQFALKWVQENIKVFGGDPKKVTIGGQSAGAASVTYQMLSTKSAGLFRGVIANSASALCPFAYQDNALAIAYGIAQEIDPHFSKNKTTKELVAFLKSVSAAAIKKTQDKYTVFAPVIEHDHDGAFVTKSMYTLVEQGRVNKVPLMIGINSEESISKAQDMTKWEQSCAHYDQNVAALVNADFYITDSKKKLEVGKKIKAIYTSETFVKHPGAAIQWNSDSSFARCTIKFADLVSNYENVYFYQFSYHGELGGNNVYIPGIGRVGHFEDQHYFWGSYARIKSYPKSDITTLERYVRLHTNFVKTLNPTQDSSDLLQHIKLPKVEKNKFYYLDIDTNLSVKENPRSFSYSKWVELYNEYARKPFISF